MKNSVIHKQKEFSQNDIVKFTEQEAEKAKLITDLNKQVRNLEAENVAVKEQMSADYARLEKTLNYRVETSNAESEKHFEMLKATIKKQDDDRSLIMEIINA